MRSLGAGPTQLAIGTSGEATVAEAVHAALEAFTAPDGRVVLPAWYRAAIIRCWFGRTPLPSPSRGEMKQRGIRSKIEVRARRLG